MALTLWPEELGDDTQLKSQRDVRCAHCGQRRTVDVYTKPTAVSCIAESCNSIWIIPEYPTLNSDITFYSDKEEARRKFTQLRK